MKPREWFVPEDCATPTAFQDKEDAISWSRNQEENIGHQCHVFHVIEKSAYDDLEKKLTALVAAVEEYSDLHHAPKLEEALEQIKGGVK